MEMMDILPSFPWKARYTMKRFLSILMILIVSMTFVFAEGAKENPYIGSEPVQEELPPMRIAALKGPTGMGLVGVMDKDRAGEDYVFTIEAKPDAILPKVVKGEVDAACIPANLASVLWNKTNGGVQVGAINTLGVVYIAEKGDTVHSIEDLRGKTIYSAGKGMTPEYALNNILKQYGLEIGKDVYVEWKTEHAEALAALDNADNAVAMLPQPFMTSAMMKNPDVREALDLNQLWYDAMGDKLIAGVVIIQKDYAEKHPERVQQFLDDYKASVEFVHENRKEAADLIGEFKIFNPQLAFKALPKCNIVFIDGEEMKNALTTYYGVLLEQNPQAVGGKLPSDEFYLR